MPTLEIVLLAVAAVTTAAMSAVAGLGGGIVLLGILLLFFSPAEAIPIHAAIQIVSNSSRALTHRRAIDLRIVGHHVVLLIPAGVLGLAVASAVPVSLGRAMIGAIALILVWRPSWLTIDTSEISPRTFVAVGGVQGFLNIPIGATGPMIAPFFRAGTASRIGFVATFAAAQVIGHVVKIGLFTSSGFAIGDHLGPIAIGALGAIAGSWLGANLLGKLSETAFQSIYRGAITMLGLRLLAGLAV